MTEKEAQRLTKQAGMGQTVPPAPRRGPKPDGVTSDGEESFLCYYNVLKPLFPMPVRQYAVEQWKIDFALPDARILIEIEGFKHRLAGKYHSDIWKYNTLAADGFIVFRTTAKMLRDDPYSFFALIERTYKERMEMRCP